MNDMNEKDMNEINKGMKGMNKIMNGSKEIMMFE
jgi:hypothetical protein